MSRPPSKLIRRGRWPGVPARRGADLNKLIFKSFQSPGDIVMLTAAVRDLHAAYPGQFQTDVRTSASELWEGNPHLTPLEEGDPAVRSLTMHYPLIHRSNQTSLHFIHGYLQYMEDQLGVSVPLTRFCGDLYLSDAEKADRTVAGIELPEHYWAVLAGGKYDFTSKWWNPDYYQAVVHHFRGKIDFVQCGAREHWHPELQGVLNLVGQTSLRDLLRVIYHAQGVLCPVTFAMHAAAALESAPGQPRARPCVVIAGGREPPQWEAYPQHRFLHTVGALSCCQTGGCWKSRCQRVGDGDEKDRRNLCEQPVEVSESLVIPRCLQMIGPEEVIQHIARYYEGGVLQYPTQQHRPPATTRSCGRSRPGRNILLEFRHGLGDAVQLTAVLTHMRRFFPDWNIQVAALQGKQSCFYRLADEVHLLEQVRERSIPVDERFVLDWHECETDHEYWPSTKVARCLLEVFQVAPRPEWMRYTIFRSASDTQAARDYLREITGATPAAHARFPVVVIHYQGNTSQSRKDLPHALIAEVCRDVIKQGYVPIVLDWDRRCPFVDNKYIFNPGAGHPLWEQSRTGQTRTGDAALIAALIEASTLMIGIDSGPLHVAGATTTPTLGVWHQQHPVRFFDLAENVTHLVPENHARFAPGPLSLAYFERAYHHHAYQDMQLEVRSHVISRLTGEPENEIRSRLSGQHLQRKLTSTAYNQTYYEEHRVGGLDYLAYGDWQRKYTRWLQEVFRLAGRPALDVGCACGAIVQGFREAGLEAAGVDLNEYMIHLGRSQWPDLAARLQVCDAVNLHLYADETFDFLHCAQVAEHWKPALVPHILAELRRVTRPGGHFFCVLDTAEFFQRSGRRAEEDDPTHLCIRPRAWWQTQSAQAGWADVSREFQAKLTDHPQSYFSRYDWDWFVARREP